VIFGLRRLFADLRRLSDQLRHPFGDFRWQMNCFIASPQRGKAVEGYHAAEMLKAGWKVKEVSKSNAATP
jgi:hypothetical protein